MTHEPLVTSIQDGFEHGLIKETVAHPLADDDVHFIDAIWKSDLLHLASDQCDYCGHTQTHSSNVVVTDSDDCGHTQTHSSNTVDTDRVTHSSNILDMDRVTTGDTHRQGQGAYCGHTKTHASNIVVADRDYCGHTKTHGSNIVDTDSD